MNISVTTNEKIPKGQKRATSRRPPIIAVALLFIGAMFMLFSGTVSDYAHGLGVPDGIYIPAPSHHFTRGEAKGGEFSHTFRIYNLRPRSLLVQAEPDCGCTGLTWEKVFIPPFGWKDLTARMKASNAAKPNESTTVGITLRTNSTQKPLIFLFLKA